MEDFFINFVVAAVMAIVASCALWLLACFISWGPVWSWTAFRATLAICAAFGLLFAMSEATQ